MDRMELIGYLLKFLSDTIPLNQHVGEDPIEVYERYVAHAENIADVALDPTEKPLFAGENGRVQTAMAIASIETFESFIKKGPIHGDCHEHADRRCRKPTDIPHSFCHMQIQPGPTGIVLDSETYHFAESGETGYSGVDLDSDPRLCNRVGLHMMRQSIQARSDLSIYTGEKKGGLKAFHSLYRAQMWYKDKQNLMRSFKQFLTTLPAKEASKPTKYEAAFKAGWQSANVTTRPTTPVEKLIAEIELAAISWEESHDKSWGNVAVSPILRWFYHFKARCLGS